MECIIIFINATKYSVFFLPISFAEELEVGRLGVPVATQPARQN